MEDFVENKFKIFVIFLFIMVLFVGCSTDKPVLKKPLEKCSARDLLEYGRALFNAEYYKDAIKQYRMVIGQFPDKKVECAWAQYEMAYSYYYLEDYDIALREFRKVIKLYPDIRGPVVLANKMIAKITIVLN